MTVKYSNMEMKSFLVFCSMQLNGLDLVQGKHLKKKIESTLVQQLLHLLHPLCFCLFWFSGLNYISFQRFFLEGKLFKPLIQLEEKPIRTIVFMRLLQQKGFLVLLSEALRVVRRKEVDSFYQSGLKCRKTKYQM